MTKVVSQITGRAAPPPIRLMEMNCAEPAKTMADMVVAAMGDKPAATARGPKMMAKGVVPIARGRISRAPARAKGSLVRMAGNTAKGWSIAWVDTVRYTLTQKKNHKPVSFGDDG